jgi:hypothetical protein
MLRNPPDDEQNADDDALVEVITEVEVLDGPLVLARSRRQVTRVAPQGAALVQTAAVAATGFVAGVATAAVLGRRRQRRLTAPATATAPAGAYRAVSHRTYLVDVHLLERR